MPGFGAIDFVRVKVLGGSNTWWNRLVFHEHRKRVLASSRVSRQAAARKRRPWLLAKAAAVADVIIGPDVPIPDTATSSPACVRAVRNPACPLSG
jgi:hypothetical protein